ncbi:MAG TPA: putative Ig domain-containing protein, partial [Lacipirellulaceae bacterium]|nr:putative Ig domain-containing protein [Lacipirellulaceae bacterium]
GSLPAWLTFDAANRKFTGTPAAGDVGAPSIHVTATDNHGGSVSDDFILTVSTSELPFNETFEGPVPAGQIAPDVRIHDKSVTPSFATTTTTPLNGSASLQATRPTVGSRPIATVDFNDPATPSNITNVSVNVSTGGGNGTTLWNNAVITFDYQSPNNYKFAGVFQIIHRLIIGKVVNGKVTYLAQKSFNASANTLIPLQLAINHTSDLVTLSSGAASVSHTFSSIGAGTVGVGTINANAEFDNLAIS